MTFDEACNILGERFRTSKPTPGQLQGAYHRALAVEPVNQLGNALKAKKIIQEYWANQAKES